MSINQDIKKLLEKGCQTKQDWSVLATHLVKTLGDYLQQHIEMTELSIIDDEALFCCIRGALPLGEPIDIVLEKILGLDMIEEKLHISASIFLFSQRN